MLLRRHEVEMVMMDERELVDEKVLCLLAMVIRKWMTRRRPSWMRLRVLFRKLLFTRARKRSRGWKSAGQR